jgi:archaellum biogenesis ATPase FlaH
LPFLKEEYFLDETEKVVFQSIKSFVEEFNSLPTSDALKIAIDKNKNINESIHQECFSIIDGFSDAEPNDEWLLKESEAFCKDKAVYNAIMDSITIIDGKDDKQSENAIPQILSDALAISFDSHIGHDYIEDSDERFDFYHRVETRTEFDIDLLNKITGGGIPNKTLNVVMAGTGVGKSMFLCHHASACLKQNKRVLYITCEMAEERIAERIDANMMDITLDTLKTLPKEMYDRKLQRATKNVTGRLIVKEYPTAVANVMHFRSLLEELKIKRNFIPDIIFIDYLNICASARFKAGSSVNSYTFIKAIAEELRGLAVEMNVPIITATQTNRSGYSNSDVSLEDTSESFGLPATADFMFALITTEELEKLGQIMIKQLKNRYGDPNMNKKFVVGLDKPKMKFYDLEDSAQTLIQSPQSEDLGLDSKFEKTNFEGWNI